jgi:FRG domain
MHEMSNYKTVNIEDLDQLGAMPERAYEIIDARGVFDEIWWRGHADSDWELLPSVHRPRYRGFEHDLVRSFMRRAKTRYTGPLPAEEAWPEWLFLMQHYGLPTRLLDWTRSPLTAAVFAVESHPDKPGAIWALNPYQWNYLANNTQRLIDPYEEIVLPYFKDPFKGAACEDRAIAVDAPEIDNRMLVQQAACTIHGKRTPLEKLEEFGGGDFVKFIIPAELKERVKKYLALRGFTRDRLFPDLHHLAQELREKLRNRKYGGEEV